MKTFKNEIDFQTIFKILNQLWKGQIVDQPHLQSKSFNNVSELHEANIKSICFFENEKYLKDLISSQAGLVLCPMNFDSTSEIFSQKSDSTVFIKVPKPYFAFMSIVTYALSMEDKKMQRTISPKATIHPTATIGTDVHIEDFVVIDEDTTIKDGAIISANTVIGKRCVVGSDSKLCPNVTVYDDCHIGNKVIIHAGAVIGADGFGYLEIEGFQIKIPQVGNVVIEDDVEIGANTCIDRATVGSTIIRANAKIDNLVQIAHNCSIDSHSILCSQVGLAGSTHIGKSVYLAGQVGVAGHLTIEDNSMVGAQSGVAAGLPSGKYFGTPAITAYEQKKITSSLKDLPAVVRFVKKQMKS
ncbi:MAG: UDP-3-O-(3-hydroxymyristoyl)glucosamine N-acyltransferase [Candidatus Cloacimonetes bacterium]|nr:UDP-3-O-(3-hydroxymyristoyl)glucosamine N-acyltransferase [Candidatus Cloacimonadota bacterium]